VNRLAGVLLFLGAVSVNTVAGPLGYVQTNLVSNISGLAKTFDPDLKNPWGISFGPTTPFWVADNGTGLSTIYDGMGAKQGLVVSIPPAPGSPAGTLGVPTGTVFNAGSGFTGDKFLFATEDGTIAGWQGGTSAAVRVDLAGSDAVFKGLAIADDRIYATDFHNGTVDVFDKNYSQITAAGAFTDPNLPSGYSPFGIETIGGSIYVTYALKEAGGDDDVAGPGFGFVDKYDTNGNLTQRLIVGVPGDPTSPLNSPWGLALAPPGFGDLAGLLLVGNFGDGHINAFDPLTGAFVSTLNDSSGNPIVIDGLWGLKFGNGSSGFNPNSLYFTAGLNDEKDGLFGSLAAVPEPSTALLLTGALLLGAGLRKRIRV
jgi:uncharacterized protein (TIGR03118 family)